MQKVLLLLCGLQLLITAATFAQTNTSPYSIVGIGDIEQSYSDRSAGMADAGVSLSSQRSMYHANPASYTALDDHFFSVEVGGRLQAISYIGNNVSLDNQHSVDMQMMKLALAVKVKKWWGSSIGLMPYSSSNYSFYSTKFIDGTNQQTQAHYNGTGGLYQFYFGNGFALGKNLSIGVQASFLFGSLIQNETLLSNIISDSIVTTRNMFLSKLVPKAGFQYKAKLSKNVKLAIGASASPSSDLRANYTLDVRQGSIALVTDKSISDTHFTLPLSYTGGASISYKNSFTVAADYSAQQWNKVNYTGLGYSLNSSNRMSLGFQYSNQKKVSNFTFENFFLQGGIYYGNTYLVINGQQLTDKGFTLGIGGNTKRSTLGYQLYLQEGTSGASGSGVLKENYTRVGFTLFYRDFWYTKVKRYD